MSQALLYCFAGLPGSGKSTLAQALSKAISALYLRVDTVEQGFKDFGFGPVTSQGYELLYRIAADNLSLGQSVIADTCNPIELTRRDWQQVAVENKAQLVNIEVICSDQQIHRQRVESRVSQIPGLAQPSWRDVIEREYHEWSLPRIVIDMAAQTPVESLATLINQLVKAG